LVKKDKENNNWTLVHEEKKTFSFCTIDPFVTAETLRHLVYTCQARIHDEIKGVLEITRSKYTNTEINEAVTLFVSFIDDLCDDQDLFEKLIFKDKYGEIQEHLADSA
jgi:hypothetical protein